MFILEKKASNFIHDFILNIRGEHFNAENECFSLVYMIVCAVHKKNLIIIIAKSTINYHIGLVVVLEQSFEYYEREKFI